MNWPWRLTSSRVFGEASRRLSDQIARLRWRVPLLALLLVLAHQTAKQVWFPQARAVNFVVDTLTYGLLGPAVVWLALGWTQRRVVIKERAEAELVQAHAELTRLNRRISFLLNVSQRLGEATDEHALADLALRLPGEIAPAIAGCALVRFDDHRQPMPVEYQGRLDEAALSAWQQHLAAPSVRQQCQVCRPRSARPGQPCPLLDRSPLVGASSVICLPLARSGQEFGILGLFLSDEQRLNREERDLLEAVVNEIAIAFESTRLRTRELTTLYEVNETVSLRLNLDGLLARILNRTLEASNADAGMLLLRQAEAAGDADAGLSVRAVAGGWLKALSGSQAERLPLVERLAAGALQSGRAVAASLHAADPYTTSVLCTPMIADEEPLGVIVLGSRRAEAFHDAQRLVSAIAGQAALLAHNARLYAQLEHQAIMTERGRLAREMHDGLAQTLGYLKMRAGQVAGWLEAGETERATNALRELAQTANEAYLDLRAALDGLRLSLAAERGGDLALRLRQLAAAFESQSGLPVEINLEAAPGLSIPAQAHLLRLAQEALTNVRKHARAGHIRLALTESENRLTLLIEDDGQGFDAGQDLPERHHGLRLMRERADLLGADLQVVSAPGAGTRVIVELATIRQWSAS